MVVLESSITYLNDACSFKPSHTVGRIGAIRPAASVLKDSFNIVLLLKALLASNTKFWPRVVITSCFSA